MNLSKEWYRSEFFNHEETYSHREIEVELPFYNAIAEGNLDYVKANCLEKAFTNPEGMGKLSNNPVQNIKYHFVITTALITRYCIHAGMEQEKAYSLSDFYIQQADALSDIKAISELHDTMCIDICKQMQLIHKNKVLSKPIVLCLDYIYNNIHGKLTLAEIADHLNMSDSYISKLFQKEMGVNLKDYILGLKIQKAENMLTYSDYTITDISNYLSFSNESHFIQVFKRYTGLTPHKYRSINFRSSWEKMKTESK